MNLGSGIHVDAHGHVGGQAPWVANRPTDRKIKTAATGRVCVNCTARLSIYNLDVVCAPCSGERWADH